MNQWFKNWGVLKQVFRHYADNHACILHAIVVLTQIAIDNSEPLLSWNIMMIAFLYYFIVFVVSFC